MLTVGDPAPDFTLRGHDDTEYSLNALRGQQVVLVFYPADFSPVCSDQLACYRDDLARFNAASARVLGISVDAIWSHKAFAREMGLQFPLLSDFHPKGAVGRAYGVHVEERGVNRRSTFVVGPDGRIRQIFHHEPTVVPEMAPIVAAVSAG